MYRYRSAFRNMQVLVIGLGAAVFTQWLFSPSSDASPEVDFLAHPTENDVRKEIRRLHRTILQQHAAHAREPVLANPSLYEPLP
jgi:hypothetical protein